MDSCDGQSYLGERWLRGLGVSHERAESGHGLADDEVLHLERALVGVERLRVGEEARDLVVEGDAIAAEQLAAPRHGLAHPHRAERLRERRLMVLHLAFGLELRQAGHQALARSDVADHLREEALDQLERADRSPELLALLRVR